MRTSWWTCSCTVAVIVCGVLMTGATVVGASVTQPAGRSLAVSVPPEPTPAPTGTTAHVPIRVLNPGSEPVSVTITPRPVRLGNNGQVSVTGRTDPTWQGRVHIEPSNATIEPQQFVNAVISVDVAPGTAPDLYFIGFLVSPVATAAGKVAVQNEIGSFITLDVPGPRVTRLDASLDMPPFVLGDSAAGTVEVTNVGHASARFWGETDPTSWPGSVTPTQQRFEKSLAPTGVKRTLEVATTPEWPISLVTVRGQIIYSPTNGSTTAEVPFSARVLVIEPWVLVVLAGLLLLALLAMIRHSRRARS